MTVSSIVYFVKMSKIQNLHFNSLREPQYPREKRKKEEIASDRIARNRKGDRTAHWLKYVPVDMGMKSENNICERIVLSPCVSCINIGRVGRKNRLGYSNLGRRRVNSEPERGRQRLSASRARCKERQKKEGFAKETRKGSNRYHRQGTSDTHRGPVHIPRPIIIMQLMRTSRLLRRLRSALPIAIFPKESGPISLATLWVDCFAILLLSRLSCD